VCTGETSELSEVEKKMVIKILHEENNVDAALYAIGIVHENKKSKDFPLLQSSPLQELTLIRYVLMLHLIFNIVAFIFN